MKDLLVSLKKKETNPIYSKNNITRLTINDPKEAVEYIKIGNEKRHIASTSKNEESSRSHGLITIYINNNSFTENKEIR